jgi:hypothetical protein
MYHSFFLCTAWVPVLLYRSAWGLRCITLSFCTALVSFLLYTKAGFQMVHSFFFCKLGSLCFCKLYSVQHSRVSDVLFFLSVASVKQDLRCTTLSSSVQHGCLSCCTAQMCLRHLHSGYPRLPETRILEIVVNSRNI